MGQPPMGPPPQPWQWQTPQYRHFPPPPPPPSGGSGCLVAAIIAIALAIVGGAAAVALLILAPRDHERTTRHERPRAPIDPKNDAPQLPQHPNVPVEEHTEDYEIAGTTAAQLRHDLDAKGPSDSDGHHDANTSWYVRWTYPRDTSGGRCATGPIQVKVTITYRLPAWDPGSGVDPGLAEKWRLYEEHLMKHEKGHAAHGVEAGDEIFEKLSKLPPSDSCPNLDVAANQLGSSIIDKYKDEDITYDATTKHGATQGAVFP